MIIVSGFNVYPNEIEDVVMGHPKVANCAAIGVPDERSGEAVKLFVVPARSQAISRSSRRRILPTGVMGNESRSTMCLGTL